MRLSRGSRWFLAGSLLVLAGIAGGLWWLDENVFVPDVESGQPIEYTVERGASVRAVGDDLAELGVVSSGVRFRLAADDQDLAARLQPGRFEFETGMATDDVIAVLAAGPLAPPTVRFTVPEGLTVDATLVRLGEQFDAYAADEFRAVLDERTAAGENAPDVLALPEWFPEPAEAGDGIVEPYEGLLWPQTYEIEEEATPLAVLQLMVSQLEREIAAIPAEQREAALAADHLGSVYEVLIVASLVERETRIADERETVAAVITNRLEQGMRLQIDATVIYATGSDAGIVSLDDLEVDSVYNTYQVDGLPPTPISGVGSAALRAAFGPADVNDLFYVLSDACDFSHEFAETLDEHNANVAAFRAADRCQP